MTETYTLDPDTTALVVVDLQNDFAHPDGALYSPQSEAVIPTVNDLIAAARDAGVEVVFTRDTHTEDQFDDAHYYDEFEQWGEHVVDGTWGHELHDDLDVDRENDCFVDKHTYDAFAGTGFDSYLDQFGIDDLVICGTLANVCVLHTAASAGLRDYRPLLVEDAVGYIEEAHREYALDHADFLFGEVVTSDAVQFTNE